MTRNSIRVFCVLGLTNALALAWTISSPHAFSATAQPNTTPLDSSIFDGIQKLGSSTFSSQFGGVAAGPNEASADVYLTSLSPSLEQSITAQYPNVPIDFIQTGNSLATLTSLSQSLQNAAPEWSAAGIGIPSWYVDIRTGKLIIQTTAGTAGNTKLDQLLGENNITVQDISAADAPQLAFNRDADVSPWNGSDSLGAVVGGTSLSCSAGFGGTTPTYGNVIITSSHCFYNNESVYNELWKGTVFQPSSGAPLVGIVKHQSDATATEVIGASASAAVWGGPINSPDSIVVEGSASNPVGFDVCTDGTYDGALGSNASPSFCGAGTGSGQIQIQSDNACATLWDAISTPPYMSSTYMLCNLVYAISEGAPQMAVMGLGDSGGPVYRFTNSGADLYAVGIIQAGTGSATCPANQFPNRTCFTGVYYSAISSVLSDWGMTLS